jgi:hypothetical protein
MGPGGNSAEQQQDEKNQQYGAEHDTTS